jgi:ribosomal protein RSM22 (predicted rRNA methylase)
MMIKIIHTSYTKQDMELVAHILNSLPRQYSEVVTNIEELDNLALADVKAKLRLFYQQ